MSDTRRGPGNNPGQFTNATAKATNHYQITSALGRYTADRERVLGRGRKLWLANSLLDSYNDDINAVIACLYEAHRLRGAA